MKTTKIFLSFSLVLIFAGLNAMSSNPKEKSALVSEAAPNSISYTVQINNNANGVDLSSGHFFVVITDKSGRLVAPQQILIPGVSTYRFSEKGPIHGTRVASIIPVSEKAGSSALMTSSKTGLFMQGASYLFIIELNPYILPVNKN